MFSDDQLRALVRESVQRHLQGAGTVAPVTILRAHPSHDRFQLPRGDDSDGACLIEPAVRCNHCGYCQSYGH
jgi:hypothetical protein